MINQSVLNQTLPTGFNYGQGKTQLDVGNIHQLLHLATTHDYLRMRNSLPWLISDVHTAGSGKMAGSTLQVTDFSWETLQNSVSWLLKMNLFGVSFCGFDLPENPQEPLLMLRWIQLGTIVPIFRAVIRDQKFY